MPKAPAMLAIEKCYACCSVPSCIDLQSSTCNQAVSSARSSISSTMEVCDTQSFDDEFMQMSFKVGASMYGYSDWGRERPMPEQQTEHLPQGPC
jgi:hypothetical protein